MTPVNLICSFLCLKLHRMSSFFFPQLRSFRHRHIHCVLLLPFLSFFLGLLEEGNLKFPCEANLLFFVILLLRGSFAQKAIFLFAQIFMIAITHYVSITKNFEIVKNLFLNCFIFELHLNYFLLLFLFHNFIYNMSKLILSCLGSMHLRI